MDCILSVDLVKGLRLFALLRLREEHFMRVGIRCSDSVVRCGPNAHLIAFNHDLLI